MNTHTAFAADDDYRLAKRAELRVDRERQARLQALMQPQPLKFALWSLFHVAVWVAAGLYLLNAENPWGQLAAVLVLGNQLHAFTVLQHDCGHQSAFRAPWLNLWVGRFMAWFIVFPFSSFTECHKYHHRYLGDPDKDPDDWNYEAGVAWMFLRIAVFVPRFIYFSLVRYGRKVRNLVLRELAFNLLSMAALCAWFVSQGMLLQFVLIFVAPLLVLALVINPVSRGYEHFPMATLAPEHHDRLDLAKNTVTVTDRLIGFLWANINYHVEHHIYPNVPFVNLRKLSALLDNKVYLRDRWLLARLFKRRPSPPASEPGRAA